MASTSRRIEALFRASLDLPPAEREAFLRDQCGDDQAMFDEVVSLLAADGRAGTRRNRLDVENLNETASLPHHTSDGLSFRPGDTVGRYEILEELGKGGFAVVYLARQEQPVRRRVALKILKPGMDTKEVLARFEAERQALALMDHPNIAKVFDAGATEQGRPYFAMEYIDGKRITSHCDEHRLSIEERLALFLQLCEAIQHAHLKAVIHRDLKPSNVLVCMTDDRPAPKVIDFGVAKAVEQKLTPDTIYTQRGALIGTPAYMSPEQVRKDGTGIDTRVDVYALGVILFQLLAGKLPFDVARSEASELSELLRAIREDEPPRPSTQIKPETAESAQTAHHRRTEAQPLRRALSGDLDWITLKALAKDRDRRYGAPKELAEDIQRYLRHEPVLARPPSAAYRARKFVRRHLGAIAAASATVLFLMVFAVTMAVQAARERRAREELAQVVDFQADRLREIDPVLVGLRVRRELFSEAQAAMGRAGLDEATVEQRTSTLEQLLAGSNFTSLALKVLDESIFETAVAAVNARFEDQPLVKARLLQSLAEEMREAGLLESATAPQEAAGALRRRVLGEDHPDTLESLNSMGNLLRAQGKLAEAENALRTALAGRRRALGDAHPDTLMSLDDQGSMLFSQGKFPDARSRFREALAGRRQVLGDDHPSTLQSLTNIAACLAEEGKLAEAEQYYREALAGHRRVLGDDHPGTLTLISNMASLLRFQGKAIQAEPFIREALAGRRRLLGDNHPNTLISIINMGGWLLLHGRLGEAEPYLREATERARLLLGEAHPYAVISSGHLGRLLNAQKRYPEAEQLLRDNVSNRALALGKDHWRTAEARTLLGEALVGLERYPEAETYLLEGYAGLDASLPGGRRVEGLARAAERLESLYTAWGKPEKAAEWRAKHPKK